MELHDESPAFTLDVHEKSPVCPFCSEKIHNAILVVSGMKNFFLCPHCNKILSVETVR